jgi:hypothetical protein
MKVNDEQDEVAKKTKDVGEWEVGAPVGNYEVRHRWVGDAEEGPLQREHFRGGVEATLWEMEQ